MAEGKKNDRGTFIPHSVIGKDDRKIVEDTSTFPSRAIVQILFTSKSDGLSRLCTGSLISPNTVLTAGHCVHSGTSSGSWYTKHIVYPGRNTGSKPFGSCLAKTLYTLGGWRQATSNNDARPYDLGAIKLDCNIGDRTGWFDLKPIGNDRLNAQTTIQGYPADLPPAGRQWKSVDMIRKIQDLNIFYQNDTFGGMSGSPVFDAEQNAIFAIHTSGLHGEEPWKSNNGSTRITPERLKTISYWREH